MQTRKVEKIESAKLAQLRKALSGYGSKAALCREHKINRQTLDNILKTGKGLSENVSKLLQ
jgi:hypothetical protein